MKMEDLMEDRTNWLVVQIRHEFDRLKLFNKDVDVSLEVTHNEECLQLSFTDGKVKQAVHIPLPVCTNEGLELLYCGDVERVLCDYWLEAEQKRLNYHEIIGYIVYRDVSEVMPEKVPSSSMIHKIINSFRNNSAPYMVHQLQRLISSVVNTMPLHETNMNSWAMNNRLIIIDPVFHGDELRDPNKRLEYQVAKNEKYYTAFGWTSIGLSDGTLADKNTILTTDLRDTVPFGHHHNPQRNLYSTLGMKGDELPRVRSKTMHELIQRGISRTGWNLFTAIIDTDMVFEDQILVSNRHSDKGHTVTRRFTVFGDNLMVDIGDTVETGGILGYSREGDVVKMDLKCDGGRVINIHESEIDVGGEITKCFVVKVEGFRFFRDGTKFSNMAGNKGIVRMMDLGVAIDPKTGEEIPIDVIVSASSINKRKNFSQIIEALTNNLCPSDTPVVVPDDKLTTKEKLMSALESAGFPRDGSWMTRTPWGERQAICGKIFWGVTKDSEDQAWDKRKPEITDNRELRKSGLKFSHVELKALTTRFGPRNALVKEIMSHAQGADILIDEMKILRSMRGETPTDVPEVLFSNVSYVDNSLGMFHNETEIAGTVMDEMFLPNGFILQLPVKMQGIVSNDDRSDYVIGTPQEWDETDAKSSVYVFDKIYIPNAFLRRCWRHPSGKWGFSTLGAHINHIVQRCYQFDTHKDVDSRIALNNAIVNYFNETARMMSTKNGDVAVYGMSVRYPHSVRGTATLGSDLSDNTIEIHKSMAHTLGVNSGDVVIAERFPCLGFMSIRPQYVKVTDDEQCRYTIRVSGNSLVSMDLDFDGDTLFVASFKTPEAIELLHKEMKNPNEFCENEICKLNEKKLPKLNEMTLDNYDIVAFPKMSSEEHSDVVRKLTGVKSHTGPVIALAYNLMRMVERNVPFSDTCKHASVEMMLHKLGNSVFQQKHGVESLQEAATDAICTADVERLVELEFSREASELVCGLIVKEAKTLGINDLVSYHIKAKEKGWSKVINKIVREFNKVYFASRSMLKPYKLLEYLECDPVDLPSMMFHVMLNTPVESAENKLRKMKLDKELKYAHFSMSNTGEVYTVLSDYIDEIMN